MTVSANVMTLPRRRLGASGLEVSAIGLGCMGMSYAYGPADKSESLRVLHRYVELGGNFLDTAEIYGPYDNERLLGGFLREAQRDGLVVATKFGFRIDPATLALTGADSSPANIRKVCDESRKRLGIDRIDLFYQHRVDPSVPIEEVAGALAELVREGKVRAVGLSEAASETLRRAHAVHPIAALQSEWSLWSRDLEDEIVPTCRELGIGIVPYSPLGRGMLTGKVTSMDDLDENDFRRINPRFQEDALAQNLRIVDEVRAVAEAHGATPAQVALAWVLAHGDDVVPIPGTKRVARLEENLGALSVDLSPDDLARLDALRPVGDRYEDMDWVNRTTPLPS